MDRCRCVVSLVGWVLIKGKHKIMGCPVRQGEFPNFYELAYFYVFVEEIYLLMRKSTFQF